MDTRAGATAASAAVQGAQGAQDAPSSSFVQLHPKNKPSSRKESRGDEEDWDNIQSYMHVKQRKLRSQFEHTGAEKRSSIFDGVSIYVNGWTEPSADELKRLVFEHGGRYEYNLYSNSVVTHTIASNLPNSKILKLGSSVVCKPEWIVESIAAGKLLPVDDYLLYKPQGGQRKLQFTKQETKELEHEVVTADVGSTSRGRGVSNEGTNSNLTSLKGAGFVDKFFVHSRLHYLSTWSMELKEFTADMLKWITPKIPRLPPSSSLRAQNTRAVVHIDLDCFFVSVSLRARPELRGKPVAVTHAKLPGVSNGVATRGSLATSDSTFHGELDNLMSGDVWLGNEPSCTTTDFLTGDLQHGKEPSTTDFLTGDLQHGNEPSTTDFLTGDLQHGNEPSTTDFLTGDLQRGNELDFLTGDLQHGNEPNAAIDFTLNELGTTTDFTFENLLHANTTNTDPMDSTPHGRNHLRNSTSDIASCSYEARAAGISNGMLVGDALRRCPNLVLLPYDFKSYREVSQTFYECLLHYSSLVEAVSCDEAYIELTDYCSSFGQVSEVVKELRDKIQAKTGCTVSAGISHNMLAARMCTRVAKPNGQFYLPREEMEHFLGSLSVRDLPGVGRATAAKLQDMKVENCGELRSVALSRLQSQFGSKNGKTLHYYARGIDGRELKTNTERKSVSVDINFGIRFQNVTEAEELLGSMAQELEKRARRARVFGNQLTLKMKIRKKDAPLEPKKFLGHGACDSISHSMLLLQPLREAGECKRLAVKLLKQVRPVANDIRGMGIQLGRLLSEDRAGDGGGGGGVKGAGGDLRKFLKRPLEDDDDNDTQPSSPPPTTTLPGGRHPLTSDADCRHILTSTPRAKRRPHPAAAAATVGRSPSTPAKPSPPSRMKSAAGQSPFRNTTARSPWRQSRRTPTRQSPLRPSSHSSPLRAPVKSLKHYFGCVPSSSKEEEDDSFRVDLPPASQLDHSVLQALPASLRDKIVEGYTSKGERVLKKKKEVSNETAKSEVARTVEESRELETASKGLGNEIIVYDEDGFLKEWKEHMRDWVSVSDMGPAEEDVGRIACYLCTLARTNLEMTLLCLKSLRHFLLGNVHEECWYHCFNTLLRQVQEQAVGTFYGGTLKLDPIST